MLGAFGERFHANLEVLGGICLATVPGARDKKKANSPLKRTVGLGHMQMLLWGEPWLSGHPPLQAGGLARLKCHGANSGVVYMELRNTLCAMICMALAMVCNATPNSKVLVILVYCKSLWLGVWVRLSVALGAWTQSQNWLTVTLGV